MRGTRVVVLSNDGQYTIIGRDERLSLIPVEGIPTEIGPGTLGGKTFGKCVLFKHDKHAVYYREGESCRGGSIQTTSVTPSALSAEQSIRDMIPTNGSTDT